MIKKQVNAWAADILEKILGNERTGPVRAYISGPMTGHAEYNRAAFNVAARKLWDKGFAVNNPAEIRVPDDSREKYMRADLTMLLGSDIMVVLPGWKNSAGAKLEFAVAREAGIPVFKFDSGQPVESKAVIYTLEPMNDLAKAVHEDILWRKHVAQGGSTRVDALNVAIKEGVEKYALPTILQSIKPATRAIGVSK